MCLDENVNLRWNISGITIVNQSNLLNGQFNNSFGSISSIKFDSNGNLFLLDKTKHRLTKYSFASDYLSLVFGHLDGSSGSDVNSLNSPNDFLIDQSNQIYLVDTNNSRIVLYNPVSSQSSVVCSQPNSIRLNSPMSIAMDNQSNILYIADYANNLIKTCSLSTNELSLFKSSGFSGDRNTYVLTPISIRFDSLSQSLVIGQETGFNVVRWPLASSSWTLVAGSASSQLNGTSRTLFNRICSIDISGVNLTFVVDCENERIQYFQGDLSKGRTIAGVIQAKGNNSYIFDNPTSIAFDRANSLFVADANNQRIQSFQTI